jgi:hypothetical protein
MDKELTDAKAYFKEKANGDPRTLRVAGIRDHGGGMRVVVTQYWDLPNHVGPGEELVLIPKIRLARPVTTNETAALIQLVERYMGFRA